MWWSWLTRPLLAVHEQEDEPLLFTLHRYWSLLPWREVRDADDQVVGWLLGPRVLDRTGHDLAVLQREPNGVTGEFRTPGGRTLAWLAQGKEGVRLTFGPEVESDPFVKMLLLAAVLNAP